MDVKIEPDPDIFEQYEKYLAVFSNTNVCHEHNTKRSTGNSNYTDNVEFESNKENIDTNVKGMCKDSGNNGKCKDNFSARVYDTVNSMIKSKGDIEYNAYKNVKCESNNLIIKTEHQDVDTEDYTHSEHAHTGERAIPEHINTDGGAVPEHTNSGERAITEHMHINGGALPKYTNSGERANSEHTHTGGRAIPGYVHIVGGGPEYTHTEGEAIPGHKHIGGAIPERSYNGKRAISIKNEVDIGPVVLQKTDLALVMQEIKQEPVNEPDKILAANTSKEIQLLEVSVPTGDLNNTKCKAKHKKSKRKTRGKGNFKCALCSTNLTSEYCLMKHYLIHTHSLLDTVQREKNIEHRVKFKPNAEPQTNSGDIEEQLNKYICDICGNNCKSKSSLRNHLKRHNSKIYEFRNGIYRCIECEVTSKWIANIKRHFKQIHTEEIRKKFMQYVCDVCGNVFKQKGSLKWHIQSKHNEPDFNPLVQRTDPCLQCSKVFPTSEYLKRHVNRYHLKHIHKECVICGTKLFSQKGLNKHMKKCQSHYKDTDIMPRQCDICKKWYKNRQGVADHKRIYHRQDHSVGKICNICGVSFGRQSSLNKHMRRTHLVLERHIDSYSKPTFPKVLKCKKCPKMFDTKRNLTHHLTTSCSNGPRVHCDLCYKTFKCKSYASDHKRLCHKDLLPYSCDRCTQTFRRKDKITSHIIQCFKL